MFLVVGILSALFERQRSGRGQVVDAAMVDGASVLIQMMWAVRGAGAWTDQRGANLLDGGALFYDTYACADGNWITVGAIEPQFYAQLLHGLGLDPTELPDQNDRAQWPVLRQRLADIIATRRRDEWIAVFAETDACVTPVLAFDEVAADAHLAHRGTLIEIDGVPQAAPAPRFPEHPPRRRQVRGGSGSTPPRCSRMGWGSRTRHPPLWAATRYFPGPRVDPTGADAARHTGHTRTPPEQDLAAPLHRCKGFSP